MRAASICCSRSMRRLLWLAGNHILRLRHLVQLPDLSVAHIYIEPLQGGADGTVQLDSGLLIDGTRSHQVRFRDSQIAPGDQQLSAGGGAQGKLFLLNLKTLLSEVAGLLGSDD